MPPNSRRFTSPVYLLQQKASEAAARQITTMQRDPNQTPQEFEQAQAQMQANLRLVIRIHSKNGDWVGGTNADLLSDKALPSGVLSIEYDSRAFFRSQFKFDPLNWFSVSLNFIPTSVFDMNSQPQVSKSTASISGIDITWANGVFNELTRFFQERRSLRGWLHSERTYDLWSCFLDFRFRSRQYTKSIKLSQPSLFYPWDFRLLFMYIWHW